VGAAIDGPDSEDAVLDALLVLRMREDGGELRDLVARQVDRVCHSRSFHGDF
jgi:hypothetical protein